MGTLAQDVRYGVRTLLRKPSFTAVAVITLTLGIGANTAIFSVVNATLLSHAAYKDPDRLVLAWEWNKRLAPDRSEVGKGAVTHDRNTVSPGNFLHWRRDSPSSTRWQAGMTSTRT
jgi:hypothetical protein